MQFDAANRQIRDYLRLIQHILYAFARQSENKVGCSEKLSFGSFFYGSNCRFKRMSAIDAFQCFIVTGFNAIFDRNKVLFGKEPEIIQFFLIDTVGARAYGYARNEGVCQGFFKDFFQLRKFFVGVGIWLKICNIFGRPAVTEFVKINTLVDLLGDAFFRTAVRWVERIITTIGTPPRTHSSVAVWTGKTGVNAEFLKTAPVFFYAVARIGIKWPVVAPWVGIYGVTCQFMLFLRWFPRSLRPFRPGRSA